MHQFRTTKLPTESLTEHIVTLQEHYAKVTTVHQMYLTSKLLWSGLILSLLKVLAKSCNNENRQGLRSLCNDHRFSPELAFSF